LSLGFAPLVIDRIWHLLLSVIARQGRFLLHKSLVTYLLEPPANPRFSNLVNYVEGKV